MPRPVAGADAVAAAGDATDALVAGEGLSVQAVAAPRAMTPHVKNPKSRRMDVPLFNKPQVFSPDVCFQKDFFINFASLSTNFAFFQHPVHPVHRCSFPPPCLRVSVVNLLRA
jgi:hypothetical protein